MHTCTHTHTLSRTHTHTLSLSSLGEAALLGRTRVADELIAAGAELNVKNDQLMTPLALAVVDEAQGNGDMV